MNAFNALRKDLSRQGIEYPLLETIPQMTFDEYIKDRMYIFCGSLFSASDYLRERSSLKFLKAHTVDLSLIIIGEKDYKGTLVSEDYEIVNEYNKRTRSSVSFKWKPKSLNTEYKPKNSFLIMVYEAWISKGHYGRHLKCIYVDQKNKSLYLFDPSHTTDRSALTMKYLVSNYFKGYKDHTIKTKSMNFQDLNSKLFYTLDYYCVTWSLMMSYLFLINNMPPKRIVDVIWSYGDKSRFLMVYFGYMLYDELFDHYHLTESQHNKLSLHYKLNADIRSLEKVNTKTASKLSDFLKFYDLFMFYIEDRDTITRSNEFLYKEIKDLLADIEKKRDIRDKFIDLVQSIEYELPKEINQKIVIDRLNHECVLF